MMFKVTFWILLIISPLANAQDKAVKIEELSQALKAEVGQVVYLDFWASWCIPCRQSFPWLNEMVNDFKEKGFKVISVNLDADKKNAESFLSDYPANFPVIYDPNGYIARQFNLPGMPSSMLFDRSGKLVSTHVGFNEEKQKYFTLEIDRLLNNK